jgi:hypothetical protein
MAMQAPTERLAYVALLNAGKNGQRDAMGVSPVAVLTTVLSVPHPDRVPTRPSGRESPPACGPSADGDGAPERGWRAATPHLIPTATQRRNDARHGLNGVVADAAPRRIADRLVRR